MAMLFRSANRLLKECDGATAVEYGIMIAAISAVIITIVIAIGSKTNNAFRKLDTNMNISPFN
jgi:pilus assembly protein Flp/PilA